MAEITVKVGNSDATNWLTLAAWSARSSATSLKRSVSWSWRTNALITSAPWMFSCSTVLRRSMRRCTASYNTFDWLIVYPTRIPIAGSMTSTITTSDASISTIAPSAPMNMIGIWAMNDRPIDNNMVTLVMSLDSRVKISPEVSSSRLPNEKVCVLAYTSRRRSVTVLNANRTPITLATADAAMPAMIKPTIVTANRNTNEPSSWAMPSSMIRDVSSGIDKLISTETIMAMKAPAP